jgi:hypothetical protein
MTVTAMHPCTEPATAAAIPVPRAAPSAPQPTAASDLTLAATSTAVNVGLMLLHLTLTKWGHPELVRTGAAVLSELLDQAVRHTGVPDPTARWRDRDDLALIDVRLLLFDHAIVIKVADRHCEPPERADAFRALSNRWHFHPTPAGRVVWCELDLSHHELTEHGLPKRRRTGAPHPQQAPASLVDRQLLQRIHEGLKAL